MSQRDRATDNQASISSSSANNTNHTISLSNSSTSKSSTSSTSKLDPISASDWYQKLNECTIEKQDLNKLILDFLVVEGYKDAADEFCKETLIRSNMDLGLINDRMDIKTQIHSGHIEQAISQLNDLNPSILETDHLLYFHLLQLQFIELVRGNDIKSALNFAQFQLAPRCEEFPGFLPELERTLSLLVFGQTTNSPVANLLDLSQRHKTAREVNSAILLSQSQEKDPKLPILIKCLHYGQSQLDQFSIYPRIDDPVSGKLTIPPQCEPIDPSAMQL